MLLPIGFAVAAEDVRQFELRAIHARRSEVLRSGGFGFNRDGMGEQVERTRCRANLASGNPQVSSGSRQAAVSEQQLNGPNIGTGFQQMDSEGVPPIPISE
jgi:hypothetical protein